MSTDKETVWSELTTLENLINTEYELFLDREQKESMWSQMNRSRRMIQEASTAEDYQKVSDRIRKLHDWLRHTYGETE